jgi:hypothetical protein
MAEVKLPKPGTVISPEDMAEMAFEVKEPHIKNYVEEWCKKHGVKCDTVAWHNWIVIKGLGGYLRQAAESWAKDQLVFFEDVHVWCDRAWPFDRLMKVPRPITDENEKAQKALIDYHCRLMGNNYFWMALDYAQGQGWETKWIQRKDNPRGGYMAHYHHGCGGEIHETKTDYVCTLTCRKCKEDWMI